MRRNERKGMLISGAQRGVRSKYIFFLGATFLNNWNELSDNEGK